MINSTQLKSLYLTFSFPLDLDFQNNDWEDVDDDDDANDFGQDSIDVATDLVSDEDENDDSDFENDSSN